MIDAASQKLDGKGAEGGMRKAGEGGGRTRESTGSKQNREENEQDNEMNRPEVRKRMSGKAGNLSRKTIKVTVLVQTERWGHSLVADMLMIGGRACTVRPLGS